MPVVSQDFLGGWVGWAGGERTEPGRDLPATVRMSEILRCQSGMGG